ncbi:universal stress protein [Massilia haematophila]|uniref:Universal stress protein n=1 Tax=Massilia haematophila TaxID=457923 RepID=A0ABV7PQD9_9BURK
MNDSLDASLPKKLLLATDLSARCDRPLERARQLAAQWQAALELLTVREGPQVPAEVVQWLAGPEASTEAEFDARRDIAREFDGCGFPVSLHFADGDVAEAIAQAAGRMDSDLVIAGAARANTLGEMFLGSTVERLARSLGRPLLVVRQRARAPYRRILVPTDFSAAARLALATAARLFPEAQLIAFHAHEAGLEALADAAPAGGVGGNLGPRGERFLDACGLPPQARARVVIDSAPGAPQAAIARYVREHGVDLAVLGLHGQAGMLRLFVGSKGEQLLRSLDCDTLLVCTEASDENT